MKTALLIFTAIFFCSAQVAVFAEQADTNKPAHQGQGRHKMGTANDSRISLNLPPKMKQHQLANMRNHLDAVRRIISAMSTEQFDQASDIASNELGLTKKMHSMCRHFKNETFKEMGMAFHKSGDDLAAVLKSGDMKGSLQALNTTMNYCVSCHATFKQ